MATSEKCSVCDFHGPELPTVNAAFRELHRAMHYLGNTVVEEFGRGMLWVLKRRR